MSFLRINGWGIPASAGSTTVTPMVVGTQQRAFDGTMLGDERAVKRLIAVKTTPVTEMVAEAIRGLAMGRGHSWSFDSDLYSGRGLGPAATIGSRRINTAADGSAVVDVNNVAEAKFGAYSLAVEPACTNILAQNKRNGTEDTTTTGFVAVVGGAIASSTTQRVQGSRSLRVITANSGDGAETTTEVASASLDYCGSFCVWTAADRSVKIECADSTGGSASSTFTAWGGKWTRMWVRIHTAPGATTIKLRFKDNAAGGATFYIDQLQIEQGTIATTWADGARAAGTLSYASPVPAGATDLTVSFWARAPAANPSADVNFLALSDASGANLLRIYRPSGTGDLRFATAGGSSDNLDLAAAGFSGAWAMYTAVLRSNPETGELKKTLYANGTLYSLGASPSSTALPGLASLTRLDVGNLSGAGRLDDLQDCLIDDLVIVPYAAPAALIDSWVALGVAHPPLPRVYVDGDVIPDSAVSVLFRGTAKDSAHMGAFSGSSYHSNMQSIGFELAEV